MKSLLMGSVFLGVVTGAAADLVWIELTGTNRTPAVVSATMTCATAVAAVQGDEKVSVARKVSTFAPGVLLLVR